MKHCLVFASLISPSKMILFEKKYQTFDTVFHHQMKHLEVRQKYSAARRIFNSLLGVSYGDETLHLMFDILLERLSQNLKIISLTKENQPSRSLTRRNVDVKRIQCKQEPMGSWCKPCHHVVFFDNKLCSTLFLCTQVLSLSSASQVFDRKHDCDSLGTGRGRGTPPRRPTPYQFYIPFFTKKVLLSYTFS